MTPGSSPAARPIVVNLEGALVSTGLVSEFALRVLRDRPVQLLRIPAWLGRGRAAVGRNLAEMAEFDAAVLPYNEQLRTWLAQMRAAGRPLVLCTALGDAVGRRIAGQLGIFDEVVVLDGPGGGSATEILERQFGSSGFEYIGSPGDFARGNGGLSAWLRALRAHQWLKNLLIFVPLLAAHDIANIDAWHALVLAFIAFSLCASAVYIGNDLLDLDSDRLHPRKRTRPFASGAVPLWGGLALAPVLLAASLVIAAQLGRAAFAWLVLYFLVTCLYSWWLKRIVLIDCITLALLYTVRVVAGAATVGHELSFWLLAFSVFMFLSLAFVKRYAELDLQRSDGQAKLHGRGYHTDDTQLIQTMGIAAGQVSVLVLALYVNSDAVVRLYRYPALIWGTVPVMLFWINWVWVQAHRGQMHDDPLIFAVKDRASLLAGALFALVLVAGSAGVPW